MATVNRIPLFKPKGSRTPGLVTLVYPHYNELRTAEPFGKLLTANLEDKNVCVEIVHLNSNMNRGRKMHRAEKKLTSWLNLKNQVVWDSIKWKMLSNLLLIEDNCIRVQAACLSLKEHGMGTYVLELHAMESSDKGHSSIFSRIRGTQFLITNFHSALSFSLSNFLKYVSFKYPGFGTTTTMEIIQKAGQFYGFDVVSKIDTLRNDLEFLSRFKDGTWVIELPSIGVPISKDDPNYSFYFEPVENGSVIVPSMQFEHNYCMFFRKGLEISQKDAARVSPIIKLTGQEIPLV